MPKNISFKNAYAIGQIKNGLSKEGKKAIENLSAEEQERLALLYRNNDPKLNKEVNMAIGIENDYTSREEKMKISQDEGFEKQGINNPTEITSNAFYYQNKANTFHDIYNLIGVGTHLSQKEQAKFNHYKDMKKTSYVQIAQNDEIIKQNDKIQKQNEQIIALLTQIANK